MSENTSMMDDSEGTSSQRSYEVNAENNYSENEDIDVTTESETKSAHSQTDCYSNTSNSDVVIETIADVISNERKIIEYNVTHNANDSDIRKPTPLCRTCCKSNLIFYYCVFFFFWRARIERYIQTSSLG